MGAKYKMKRTKKNITYKIQQMNCSFFSFFPFDNRYGRAQFLLTFLQIKSNATEQLVMHISLIFYVNNSRINMKKVFLKRLTVE